MARAGSTNSAHMAIPGPISSGMENEEREDAACAEATKKQIEFMKLRIAMIKNLLKLPAFQPWREGMERPVSQNILLNIFTSLRHMEILNTGTPVISSEIVAPCSTQAIRQLSRN